MKVEESLYIGLKEDCFGVSSDMHPFNTCQSTWPMTSGIYAISVGPRHYVGMAGGLDGFKGRWSSHRSELRAGDHCNNYMQYSYNKYGSSEASFSVLEEIRSGDANHFRERENHWMRTLDTTNQENGYNVYGYAESGSSALRHSEETRAIIAKKATGRKLSEETKLKISKSWETRVVSEETKRKMSMSMMGKTHTKESILKMSRSQKGRTFTKEHRRKISESYRRTAHSPDYIHPNSRTYECIDPTGKIVTISNLTRFCRDNSLCRSVMLRVCLGKTMSCKGYRSLTFVSPKSRKKYDFMAPDGSIKECYVIRVFAHEHGLTQRYIHRLIRGHISTRKGWKLVKDYTK